MTSDDYGRLLALILPVLQHLASPVEIQLEYLEKLGSPELADELALEFGDTYPALKPLLVDNGDEIAVQLLNAIDVAWSNRSIPWDTEYLGSAPEWEHIRHLARPAFAEALKLWKSVGSPRLPQWDDATIRSFDQGC